MEKGVPLFHGVAVRKDIPRFVQTGDCKQILPILGQEFNLVPPRLMKQCQNHFVINQIPSLYH